MLSLAGMPTVNVRSEPHEPSELELPDWAREDADLAELFRGFVERLPARADSMEMLLERQELHALQEEAHQLKGTAGAYGFPYLSEAAAALESTVRAHLALETVRAHVHEVVTLCRHAGRRD